MATRHPSTAVDHTMGLDCKFDLRVDYLPLDHSAMIGHCLYAVVTLGLSYFNKILIIAFLHVIGQNPE